MSSKRVSIKLRLLLMSLIPVLITGIVVSILSITTIQKNMLKEALDGLQAACNMYREELITTERDLTTNELEDEYKRVTGYDFTRFEGNTRAATSVIKADGSRPIGTTAAPEVVAAVINGGQQFTSNRTDVAGQDYCVAYSPIMDGNKVIGMAFAGKPRKDLDKAINDIILLVIFIIIVLVIIISIAVYFITVKLASIILSVSKQLENLSAGNLKVEPISTKSNDELGDTLKNASALSTKLSEVVTNIKQAMNTSISTTHEVSSTIVSISDTSDSVSNAVQGIAKGAAEQADLIQNTSISVGALADAIQRVDASIKSLQEITSTMQDDSNISATQLKKLQSSMQIIAGAMEEITSSIKETSAAVTDINTKVDGITNIATQTNLLALNASIEAARAGDAGKGFAVVAEEIGKLASESGSTAEEIKRVVGNLVTSSNNAIHKAEDIDQIQTEVSEVISSTVSSVEKLISGVGTTIENFDSILEANNKCVESKLTIEDAMGSLSAISEENAASTEETAASMQELNANMNELTASADELVSVTNKVNDTLNFFSFK